MNLNERAAKCMGWAEVEVCRGAFPYPGYTSGWTVYEWNPEHDYNHARMLYQRAIEVAPNATRDAISLAVYALSQTTDDFVTELDLTAQQLTEACCEALEAHDESH